MTRDKKRPKVPEKSQKGPKNALKSVKKRRKKKSVLKTAFHSILATIPTRQESDCFLYVGYKKEKEFDFLFFCI